MEVEKKNVELEGAAVGYGVRSMTGGVAGMMSKSGY